jgi:hypothetical protein
VGAKRLLAVGDLRYEGSFAMPASVDGLDAAWGRGFAIRPVNGQLRAVGATVYGNAIYEAEIPALTTVTSEAGANSLPVARLVRNWGDITSANRRLEQRAGGGLLRGLYFDSPTQRLMWTYGDPYNTTSGADPSIGWSQIASNGSISGSQGPWRITGRSCKMTMGGICAIPDWFAQAHTEGRRLGAGFGGYESIVATGPASMGPTLTAFSPEDMRAGNADITSSNSLVGYPFSAPAYATPDRCIRSTDYVDDFDGWNPRSGRGYWTWSDMIAQGGAWIDTPEVSGYAVLCNISTGRVWYETSTLHSSGEQYWLYIFAPEDMAAVASGQRQQWEIQPRVWQRITIPGMAAQLPGHDGEKFNEITGVSWEPSTRQLFVAVRRPGGPGKPSGHLVSVYRV